LSEAKNNTRKQIFLPPIDMPNSDSRQTPRSLLERLRQDPTDHEAWSEFIRRYRARIHGWCVGRGLQEADAEDVTQNVFLKLTEKMRDFRYDPTRSFRAWLHVVTRNAAADFLDGLRLQADTLDVHLAGLTTNVEARIHLARRLEEAFDHEVLETAMGRVRARVKPKTWEAFRLTALEGKSAPEAGEVLSVPVAHIFVAKNRVQKMLEEEIRNLGAAEP
jgi:RNA polymerase sigma factor (sigma-70 family)